MQALAVSPDPSAERALTRGAALVVESDAAQAGVIAEVVRAHQCGSVTVASAEEAVARFEAEQPDIVFISVDLPGMDGFEATTRIKRLAGERFVPVMLLAHERDEALLLRCVESGADDFLLKPVDPGLIRARLLVMERVCELQSRMAEQKAAIAARLEQERIEQELAERVLSRAVTERNVVMDRVDILQRSAAIFSGDMVLTQHLPDGGLRLLVGDFTGHGLAAAVAALPIADVFHAMTLKGAGDELLLAELNRKLYELLPPERFMAAILVTIPAGCTELRWWNGGMPSGWLRTPAGLQELTAHALPLGILPELPTDDVSRRVRVARGDRLLLMTDGLLEAHDSRGRMLLDAGFDEILQAWRFGASVLPALRDALDRHSVGVEQADDIAIVDIPIGTGLFAPPVAPSCMPVSTGWGVSVTLSGQRLRVQPTVEGILSPLGLVDGIRTQMAVLETILSELYSNALEHGVLKLDSCLKATPEGFDAFYRERAQRLADARDGQVSVQMCFDPTPQGGSIRLRVCDSGDGFDENALLDLECDPTRPWGRGIPLLKSLCDSVEFKGNGSQVEVVYRW